MVVEWGGRWWPASVVAELGGDVWKVHYDGWSDSWDEAVGPDRIRADPGPRTPSTSHGRAPSASGARMSRGKVALVLGGLLVLASIAATTFVEQRPGAEQERGLEVDGATSLVFGQPVQIEWNGSWFTGAVLAVHDDGRVRVHYGGWADSYDEDVPRDRLRVLAGGTTTVAPRGEVATAETELSVGQPVQVDWNGSWYAATVLALTEGGEVRIHYEGWADSYDEDVPRSRIRAPGAP